jgi:hypothetical protein
MYPVRYRLPGVLLVLGLVFRPSFGAALELQLANVRLMGGEVRFSPSLPEPIDALPIEVAGDEVQTARTPQYVIFLSPDDISLTKLGFIRYRFYVKPRSGLAGGVTRFVVNGEPIGSFLAQAVDVDMYLGDSSENMEQTKISLPVFSSESPDYLAAPSWTLPEEVEIGGEANISIRLQNLLKKWPVAVVSVRPPRLTKLWRKTGFLVKGKEEFQQFEVHPAATAEDMLVLHLVPNSGRALTKALFPRKSQGEHDRVTAHLEYSTRWGTPRELKIEIPIRFVPFPPFLFLAVIAGTVLGSLVSLAAGQTPRKKWRQAFGAALLTAFLAELLAMLLVQLDSEFRLLGFTLDPFQLLPAAIIGALMGLFGTASLETMKKALPGRGAGAAEEGKK